MALSGTVFIDRSNRKSAIAAFDGAIREIRDNKQSVWIFPEGTRSHFPTPDLLPFKKGAFHLAIQAGVPIVPVVVANYSHVLYVRDRSFEQGLIKIKVCLYPLPQIYPGVGANGKINNKKGIGADCYEGHDRRRCG